MTSAHSTHGTPALATAVIYCVVNSSPLCLPVSYQQGFKGFAVAPESHHASEPFQFNGADYSLSHGSVVIAAITSCTNTSNPSVMLGAGTSGARGLCLGQEGVACGGCAS